MRTSTALTLSLALAALLAPAAAAAQLPNPYGPAIGVEAARKAAQAAIAEAAKNGWRVAVAVVDPGGSLVYFERIDETQKGSTIVSVEKARSSAAFKRPTKAFEDAIVGGRTAVLGLPGAVPLDGGLPIVTGDKIVGAIGVSGATSAQDGQCAKAGVEALEAKGPAK
jgi:glc operon protein GlcG